MQKCDRPEVDVQVQTKPQAEQNVACVLVARHARISKRSEKDRVHVIAQVRERCIGQRFLCLQVVIG